MPANKEYLGDSVYVRIVDQTLPTTIVLTTENGYHDDPRNKIILEAEVLENLFAYLVANKVRVRFPSDAQQIA